MESSRGNIALQALCKCLQMLVVFKGYMKARFELRQTKIKLKILFSQNIDGRRSPMHLI